MANEPTAQSPTPELEGVGSKELLAADFAAMAEYWEDMAKRQSINAAMDDPYYETPANNPLNAWVNKLNHWAAVCRHAANAEVREPSHE